MKKIVITGAFGFIGSHLTEFLIENGYNVIAFDRYNSNNHFGWLQQSKYFKDIEFILGDIRDYDSVYKVLKKSDMCIHLAALVGIPYSYVSPLAYIRTNIEGTYNILESSKNLDINELIITSTSETYGSAQYNPIDEKHPLVGQSPYSASKISSDQLTLSYHKSFNLPIKIARPFNVFGPRQSTRAIIPTIVSQLMQNKGVLKLGNINTRRDFTYVQDTCSAYLAIMKCDDLFGHIINIGCNENISIEDLVYKISQIMKINPIIEEDVERKRNPNSEVDVLKCDNSKILKYTDWSPSNKFLNSLEYTIDWYKKNNNLFNAENYHV